MEGGQDPVTLKITPTCSTTAWGWAWEEEREEGSPTQEVEEEVDEGGEEEEQRSPRVRQTHCLVICWYKTQQCIEA